MMSLISKKYSFRIHVLIVCCCLTDFPRMEGVKEKKWEQLSFSAHSVEGSYHLCQLSERVMANVAAAFLLTFSCNFLSYCNP